MTRTQSFSRRRGASLTENMIAIAVLGLSVVGVTEAVVSVQMHLEDATVSSRATILAEDLLERVVALPYDDPTGEVTIGPEAGENDWTAFDNIDDYDAYTEEAGSLIDASGRDLDGDYDGFTRSVDVTASSVTVAALGGSIGGLTVTVTVQDPRQSTWTLTHFIPEPVEP